MILWVCFLCWNKLYLHIQVPCVDNMDRNTPVWLYCREVKDDKFETSDFFVCVIHVENEKAQSVSEFLCITELGAVLCGEPF